MSTFLYGKLSALREGAPADRSNKDAPPGLNTLIDAAAALVPAEVLVVHGVIVSATTTVKGATTTVDDPTTLAWSFVGMVVLSIMFYALGRRVVGVPWVMRDVWRGCVPPLAFIAWTMLQRATAFDGAQIEWSLDMSEGRRVAIGAFLAVVVAAVAAAFAAEANKSDPPST